MDLGDITPAVAASVGVAISGTPGETADDLLRNADVAMYAAKASSRGRAQVFHSILRAEAVARSEVASLLRGVEARCELVLDYQPIVELAGAAVVGLEALVRWQPPNRPLLMPDKFIDLAEQTGDIVQVSEGGYSGMLNLARKAMKLVFMRRADAGLQVVEVDLARVFADSAAGRMGPAGSYQRVAATLPYDEDPS